MLSQFSANPRKVIVSLPGVLAFNATWPCSELRARSYWFAFDDSGDLVDSDVPEHDDGPAASAMADDCKAWLMEDENPAWAADNDSPMYIETEEEEPRENCPDCEGAGGYGKAGVCNTCEGLGTVTETERVSYWQMIESQRKEAFRACPILSDYIATALQDLQYSESEEACEEEREPRDSGTIYTLPAAEFEKAKAVCESFMADHAADIEAAGELVPGEEGLEYTTHRYMGLDRIGSTLYLARVGSGVTFTDDGNAPCLQRLADAARAVHAESPYFGDDGRVYGF